MKPEKEYLKEVSKVLDAISRAPNENRKREMRKHLHRDLYPQKNQYGFVNIDEVRQSADHVKAGRPDPTQDKRYDRIRNSIAVWSKNLAELEKGRELEKSKQTSIEPGLMAMEDKNQEQELDMDRDGFEDLEPDEDLEME